MGITRLMFLLRQKCPQAIKQTPLSSFLGCKFAIDASMSMYQFLISTQSMKSPTGFSISELKDPDGNLTGHLLGLYNRSIFLLENGIKPVWVFDGKPPDAKIYVLKKRKERKENAEKEQDEAEDQGDMEKALKMANQNVKISAQMVDDAKKLIKLLGLPMVEAPAEAEATCSYLTKIKKVDATVSEDMDCLCFGCPILLRDLNNKDNFVIQVKLDEVLKGLNITMEQFVDLCILCGCDYTPKIEGIGPVNALKLVQDYKNIEGVIKYTEKYNKDESHKKKLVYNEDEFQFEMARDLFNKPEVVDTEKISLEWKAPNFEELKKFLVDEKGFNESRIDNAIKKLEVAKNKAKQVRLDNFFAVKAPNTQSIKLGVKKEENKMASTFKKRGRSAKK